MKYLTHKQIVEVFTEWDRLYRNDPGNFMSDVEHLLRNTPDTYGNQCAVYFEKIIDEIKKRKKQKNKERIHYEKTRVSRKFNCKR
jgi:hypothetical protein